MRSEYEQQAAKALKYLQLALNAAKNAKAPRTVARIRLAISSARQFAATETAARDMLAAHERNAKLDVDLIRREGRLAEVLRAIVADARAAIAAARAAGFTT